jgi:hypothetical protein
MRAERPRSHGALRRVLAVLAFALFFVVARRADALVVQAPFGGDSFALPQEKMLCTVLSGGWVADTTRRRVRPPTDGHVGQVVTVTVANASQGCGGATETMSLVATGPIPTFDPTSVTVWVDAGRLEVRGDGLEGARLGFSADNVSGSDLCLGVSKDKGHDVCAVNVDTKLPANPLRITLKWAPAGGRTDADVRTYDASGTLVPDDQLKLPIARVIIGRVLPPSRTADVSSGEGTVALVHPEAVSSADCTIGRCEFSGTGIVVRGVPAQALTITVRVRLAPRVFIAHGDAMDTTVTEPLAVLRCPLTLLSGQPLREVDNLKVLVRLDKACSNEVDQLKWTASGEPVEVTQVVAVPEGANVLLRIGRVASEHLTIVASRTDDGSVIAVATEKTWEPPPLRTSLELPNYGEIEFIPKNRDALLSISPVSTDGKIVPIAVPGAYTVTEKPDGFHIRGVYTSGGYTSLRFAYRSTSVPKEFADTDFATLMDPVQRPIREASVPAPLGASSITKTPIVELLCAGKKGKLESIAPGTAPHIPFSARDSCRLIVHRDRIPPEDGEQRLDVDVTVNSVSGAERGEAKLSQHLLIRNGPANDVIWVRGAKEQFDHINIRVTHVIDETQYLSQSPGKVELPSAQWTIVTENSSFRFYATAAIPASLYRFSKDPQDLGTGPLALNFGILSRITWLDHDGHEGIVGLESGVMAMGLETEKARQLAIVMGLGVSIPLGNVGQPTQASVNIHAWAAYTVGDRTGQLLDTAGVPTANVKLNPWGFVFGPSITIGNIGAFL